VEVHDGNLYVNGMARQEPFINERPAYTLGKLVVPPGDVSEPSPGRGGHGGLMLNRDRFVIHSRAPSIVLGECKECPPSSLNLMWR